MGLASYETGIFPWTKGVGFSGSFFPRIGGQSVSRSALFSIPDGRTCANRCVPPVRYDIRGRFVRHAHGELWTATSSAFIAVEARSPESWSGPSRWRGRGEDGLLRHRGTVGNPKAPAGPCNLPPAASGTPFTEGGDERDGRVRNRGIRGGSAPNHTHLWTLKGGRSR